MVVSRDANRGGEQPAFLDLLNAHQGAIRRICHAYAGSPADRQDLFQEVVYQLWRSFPSYRQDASAFTWLYRVSLNTAITSMRRRTRRPAHVPLEAAGDPPGSDDDRRPEVGELYRAIKHLNDVDRALVMCYLDDLSYHEIAGVLGISASNVGARLTRVKAKLQRLVTGTE